ncbi:MAG: hypothetical protein SF123_15395 [Chloroflexota bacterium]|nr:hypothetical protein [Chloroflexota bacterium]
MQTITPDTIPDYHFLLIPQGLGVEWFFDVSRVYFDRFRPTVITDFALVQLVPADATLAVTTVARRDSVANLGVQLAQLRPDALFDAVTRDTPEETRTVLVQRAERNEPFGVPLTIAQPTPPPGATLLPSIPTPMVPTQGGDGWVTVTPVPPTPVPQPTPADPGNPIEPIEPTPGSLIGG